MRSNAAFKIEETFFSHQEFRELVASLGHGEPTEVGYMLGEYMVETGDNLITAANHIVQQKLVTHP